MRLMCKFDGTYLIPSSQDSQEEYEKLRKDQEYNVEVKQARNPGHHRKAMALLTAVMENQDRYDNFEDLLVEFKLCTGWYREHITTKGVTTYVPKSISFAQMDQTAFETFYNRALGVAHERFGMDVDSFA